MTSACRPDRIERMGEHDNFWPAGAPSQGPDGVCGPCSEIFYHDDFGDSVEIWNLVFTQFNRVGEPPDNLRPLPSKNIDTGMGLERTAACLQGVPTNFHIDILKPIRRSGRRRLRRAVRVSYAITAGGCAGSPITSAPARWPFTRTSTRDRKRRSTSSGVCCGGPCWTVISWACASRSCTSWCRPWSEMMKTPYPELAETTQRVADVIKNEEANFLGTIDAGLAKTETIFAEMAKANRTTVNGAEAADLYQTYGVPPEVFETMAAERNLAFDWEGYRRAMDAARRHVARRGPDGDGRPGAGRRDQTCAARNAVPGLRHGRSRKRS